MRLSLVPLILLAAFLASPRVSAQETTPADDAATPDATGSIVAVLEADGRFTTLLGALETANLTETLSGDGPFTLFAPTDEAFAALPEGTLDSLTPEELQGLLLYHVVSGAVDSGTAAEAGEAPTAWGENTLLFTPADDGGLMIGEATVVDADLAASNGVIHAVDGVLMPPARDDMSDEEMEDMDDM